MVNTSQKLTTNKSFCIVYSCQNVRSLSSLVAYTISSDYMCSFVYVFSMCICRTKFKCYAKQGIIQILICLHFQSIISRHTFRNRCKPHHFKGYTYFDYGIFCTCALYINRCTSEIFPREPVNNLGIIDARLSPSSVSCNKPREESCKQSSRYGVRSLW